MPNEKKLYQIIFEKDKKGKNMNITITNIKSDNENIIFIKDYGFENHYPMLSSNNWDQILIEKNKTTSIFIENPYDKLKGNELFENETFIIYIANTYDENGRPYFEEEKYEIKEINYKNNSLSKYNKFDFQVIEMDRESSVILSQSNKNTINDQMIFCNKSSFSYNLKIDYSNSNISSQDYYLDYNYSDSFNIQNKEIISHTFYMNDEGRFNLLFYYNFDTNMKSNLFSFSNEYKTTIDYVKALDENHLEIKFSPHSTDYYKFYIIVALVDENNTLSSFNQYCYLTKLITENINSNYSLKIVYGCISYYDYIITKIDISNLKANIKNKFVINIINENLYEKKLEFNSALEFIPDMPKEIVFYNSYEFNVKKNNCFRFNYNDTNLKEFLLQIDCSLSSSGTLIIYIEGPDINSQYTVKTQSYLLINVLFNLTKPGIIYLTFNYANVKNEINGNIIVHTLKKKIDIIDFREKIYFFNHTLETGNSEKIFIYNVTNLTEDRLVYFSSHLILFEICDISSKKCKQIDKFYKFLANKEYIINVYTYDTIYHHSISYLYPFVFGIFTEDNIKLYNDLGADKNNIPTIYIIKKEYTNSFYFININNVYLYYFERVNFEIDEVINQLPNLYFNRIYDEKYQNIYFLDSNYIIVLVFPNFNYELKSYESFVIVCSNNLYINKGTNEDFEISPGESAFIMIEEEPSSQKTLKDYYNSLRLVKSQYNNIGMVDYNSIYDKFTDTLTMNSIDYHSDYIYIDKSQDNNKVQLLNYESRYSYFYALDDSSLKNRTKIMKEKGYYSYFKRQNSDIGNIYDTFNKIIFELEDKISIYFKKYFGNSNIYEINLESFNINDLFCLTKPIKTYENEKSILNQLTNLKKNKLYSGFLDLQTLYDIYIDIDNEENIIKMQEEDNSFNNLIKLFKSNINYILDFEVHHLIKLDPNFNAEVILTDSKKTIKLNNNNPITKEIKGNNVQITTNSTAILYFYNSISSLTSTSEIYKNMFQYEIESKQEKNLYLDIELIGDNCGYIHYLIDIGFKGYTPFESQSFNFTREFCNEGHCSLYIPNYYDKIKTELVEGEKLFVYYYLESDNPHNLSTNHIATYISSLKNINNDQTFYVIPPNIEGEEEKNLFINFNNKNKLSMQVNYCSKNDGTNPILNYYDILKEILKK